MASSRLASSTSTVGAMSGTLPTIFGLCGGRKWMTRDGRNGMSRTGSGHRSPAGGRSPSGDARRQARARLRRPHSRGCVAGRSRPPGSTSSGCSRWRSCSGSRSRPTSTRRRQRRVLRRRRDRRLRRPHDRPAPDEPLTPSECWRHRSVGAGTTRTTLGCTWNTRMGYGRAGRRRRCGRRGGRRRGRRRCGAGSRRPGAGRRAAPAGRRRGAGGRCPS